MDDLIKQGADAFRAGNRDDARKLLLAAVKQNPDSERAWGWLYNVIDDDKERIYCLKQMLRINPNNEKASQLLESLTGLHSQPETHQPQIAVKSVQTQPINSKLTNPKSRRLPLILIGVLAPITLCICGVLIIGQFFNASSPNGSAETATARVLSAQDVFEVDAVNAVKADGYTVTSSVCEVVSPISYLPSSQAFGGQLVFHAFRLTGPHLNTEAVVLFASNHTAANGAGLVFPVNAAAIGLNEGFSPSSKLVDPVTVDTPGAETALACARQVGAPALLKLNNFDVEAWRSEAIKKFGPEQAYSDGSKDDYVQLALSICKQTDAEHAAMRTNLGARYEGSIQQFVIDTFCPYTK